MPKRVPGALGALPMVKSEVKLRVSAEKLEMSFKSSKFKFFLSLAFQHLGFYHWQVLIRTPLSHIEVMAAFFGFQVELLFHGQKERRTNVALHGGFIAFWHRPIQQTEQVSLYTWKSALFTLLVHIIRDKNTTRNVQNHLFEFKSRMNNVAMPKGLFSFTLTKTDVHWQDERLLDVTVWLFRICLHSLQMASFSEHRSASIHITLHTCIFWSLSRVTWWQDEMWQPLGALLCTASIIKA